MGTRITKLATLMAIVALSLAGSVERASAGFGVIGYICGVGHSAEKTLPYIGSIGASGYLGVDLTSEPNCQGTYYMVAACTSGATASFCTARFSETVLMRHLDLLRVALDRQSPVYMYLTQATQGGNPIYNPLNFFYYK